MAPQLIANCGTRRVHKGRGTFHVNCSPCTALLALCTRQAQSQPQPQPQLGGLRRVKVSFRVSLKVSVWVSVFVFVLVFVVFGVAFASVLR